MKEIQDLLKVIQSRSLGKGSSICLVVGSGGSVLHRQVDFDLDLFNADVKVS